MTSENKKESPIILHLTHSEIRTDSRTLKQVYSARVNSFSVYGIGLSVQKGLKETKITSFKNIVSLNVLTKKIKFLPKKVCHILVFLEVFPRVLFKAIKIKPDIIHCSDFVMLPISVVVKLFTNSKIVYDAHELESEKNGNTLFMKKLILFLEKACWPCIDALLVVSPSIKEWYLHQFGGEKNISVVMNSPIHEEMGLSDKNYLRHKFNIPSSHVVCIYVGIFCKGRGIENLLKVFSQDHINASIVFLGYGDLENEITAASQKGHNVYFHKGVEHEKVTSIVTSADYGMCLIENVSLSDYYSLPNKLFEYVFSGIPVIASNFPDMKELVEKYKLGVCSENSYESILSLVKSLKHPETKENKNIKSLSWEAQAKKMISLYNQLLK